jgi:hypothetical protein
MNLSQLKDELSRQKKLKRVHDSEYEWLIDMINCLDEAIKELKCEKSCVSN